MTDNLDSYEKLYKIIIGDSGVGKSNILESNIRMINANGAEIFRSQEVDVKNSDDF